MFASVSDVGEELFAVGDIQRDGIARGQHHGVGVHGKIRRRHDGGVAGAHQGQAHVAEPLLGAEADDHLPLGIEPDAVLLEILGGHLAAEIQQAQRLGVSVVLGVAGGLGQLVNDQILRRVGRVAHPQVDHVVAGPPLLVHQPVDPGEEVGRQARDPVGHLDREGPVLVDRFAWVGVVVHGGSRVGREGRKPLE